LLIPLREDRFLTLDEPGKHPARDVPGKIYSLLKIAGTRVFFEMAISSSKLRR
jgi:hypothetical protein